MSQITCELESEMSEFRNRSLDKEYKAVLLDATYIKTRRVDKVSSEAYYVCLVIKEDYSREVISIQNAPTESAANWDDIRFKRERSS